ncbi:MAG: methyltransferase domain-containing protein [Bacteroidota bacterium]
MRLIQHKQEAYWFYRFLSIFYDDYVNPLFWTAQMRDQSLELAQFESHHQVIDVGSGTGFTTSGIVQEVPASQVTCVDQSPHQMAKAKQKAVLQDCHFQLGDAENIPFPTDHFDRYVSAGSIEYWPDPQKGITEAYRVIKPDGIALLIGPLEPANGIARFLANTWMLFPKDREYRQWYERAGFVDIQVRYIKPQWHNSTAQYGIAIAGRKPNAGESPMTKGQNGEATKESIGILRFLQIFWRVLVGSIAGFVFIPIALIGYLFKPFRANKEDIPAHYRERLNSHQIGALFVVGLLVGLLIWYFS